MKVVFIEDVPGTAKIGDIKDVKPGFARNYLLPRRLAMAASPSIIKTVEQRAAREARLQEARDNEGRTLAEKLEGVTYTVNAKAGSTGKLFGSVGASDVAEKVGVTLGAEFDRHNITMDVIKDLGDYQAVVKLTKNVSATVNVTVVGEDGTTAADIKAKAEGTAPELTIEEAAAAADNVETPEAPVEESRDETSSAEEEPSA
jgi:large subunit ribosomal protein L9